MTIPAKITTLDAIEPSPSPEPASETVAGARVSAIFEILLCSGIPSQFALASIFALAGFTPLVSGRLSLGYITALLLLDATILIGLIFWLLRRHGERPRDVFLGARPIGPEIYLGVPMTAVVFVLAVVVLSTARLIVPSLHNVQENPLQQLIQTPTQAVSNRVIASRTRYERSLPRCPCFVCQARHIDFGEIDLPLRRDALKIFEHASGSVAEEQDIHPGDDKRITLVHPGFHGVE